MSRRVLHSLGKIFNCRDLSLLVKVEPLYCKSGDVAEIFLTETMYITTFESLIDNEYKREII